MTRWKVSVGIARKVATREAMPALATTTSSPPKRSTVSATARWTAPRSVTSAATPDGAGVVQLGGRARGGLRVEVGDRDRGAPADQRSGGGEPDPTGAPGDEGDLA